MLGPSANSVKAVWDVETRRFSRLGCVGEKSPVFGTSSQISETEVI